MEEEFTYFWHSASPFSQWHPCRFTLQSNTFNCAEQYMMWAKAMLFGDIEVANKILKAKEPSVQKSLGRQVKNFDQKKWEEHCERIVYEGNHAKFSQNPNLLKRLIKTGETTLVEASPYDRIWGIGLAEHDPRARYRETWLGKNLLGQILTDLREDLVRGRRIYERIHGENKK